MKDFRLYLLFLIIITPLKCLAQNEGIETYDIQKSDIRIKYAKKQQTHHDSICCIPLYEIIDKWDGYIKQNSGKIKTVPADGVFVQYIYYLTYNCKIPSSVKRIYIDKKTYPFKNLKFINTGDLIFYGKTMNTLDNVALALQNNFVVYADMNGVLLFKKVDELLQNNVIVPAKIMNNE